MNVIAELRAAADRQPGWMLIACVSSAGLLGWVAPMVVGWLS